jgi:rhodanese-related sulfurtransferase
LHPEAPGLFGSVIDVSAQEALDALKNQQSAQLVDVRSDAEWKFSGLPNLESLNKQTITISLKTYPDFSDNPDFLEALVFAIPERSTPIYFLCKTGGRSRVAAKKAQSAGYTHAYNIAGGFEGEFNQQRQRGQVSGWKAAQLPWEQA